MRCRSLLLVTGLLATSAAALVATADDTDVKVPAVSSDLPAPRLKRLHPKHSIWIDVKRKIVVVDGEIAMREGPLEMFACPKGTKEHESIIAVHCDGVTIHAGLIAVGALAGHPVRFDPRYEPATGTAIEILILWQDDKGRHKVRAQEWVYDAATEKALEHDWVFGGSGLWTDETTGKKYYHADAGDLICVSNFATAMLDLPIESSQANDGLLYSAFTENIPPRGTKVRLVLCPRKAKTEVKAKAEATPTAETKAAGESTETPDRE